MMWPQQIPIEPWRRISPSGVDIDPVQQAAEIPPVAARGEQPRSAPDLQPDSVAHWMQGLVATCSPEQTLGELAELLSLHHISGVPVVDSDSNLLGVVSQSDVARYLGDLQSDEVRPSSGYYRSYLGKLTSVNPAVQELLCTKTVAELLTPHVHSVTPDASLDEVIELMLHEHVHRLPVVWDGKLVGLVSTLDVLRVVRAERSLNKRRKLRRRAPSDR